MALSLDADLAVDLRTQPKQHQLLKLVEQGGATWIGYGGARGGGKSAGLRIVMLARRFALPQTRGLIFRRTYKDLWENHIDPLFRQFPHLRQFYNGAHRELRLPNDGGESVVVFGYAEHAGDIYSFLGKEYMDICIDEATQMTEQELVFLKTCNRWPGTSPDECKMILGMNPGGPGHAFVKRIFHDQAYHERENPGDYAFVQAYGWDNIEWCRAALSNDGLSDKDYYSWEDGQRFQYFITRSDYGRTLDRLPASLRIGHLLGRWDVFAGQYFDIFDPSVHVARPEQLELKPWNARWLGIDWGFAHDAAVHWCAQDGARTVIYREFVAAGRGPRALAEEIADRSSGEKIDAIYLSPDAYAKRTSEDTIAQQMEDVFRNRKLPQPSPADDDRVGGWMLMYELLRERQLVVCDQCPRLIQTLPMMSRDDKKLEDCVKFEGDDAADSARYALKSRLPSRRPPLDVRVAERLKAADDARGDRKSVL